MLSQQSLPQFLALRCFRLELRQAGYTMKEIKVSYLKPRVEPPQFLYIQMDYCERTLRHAIDDNSLFEVPYLPGSLTALVCSNS